MWAPDEIHSLEIESLQLLSKRGGKYIPTPAHLTRLGIINVKSSSSCFVMCVTAGLFLDRIKLDDAPDTDYDQLTANQKRRLRHKWTIPDSYTEIMQDLQDQKVINFTDFLMHVDLEDVSKFEQINRVGVAVFSFAGDRLYPLRLPNPHYKPLLTKFVDLLLLEDDSGAYHFTCVRDLPAVFGRHNMHRYVKIKSAYRLIY